MNRNHVGFSLPREVASVAGWLAWIVACIAIVAVAMSGIAEAGQSPVVRIRQVAPNCTTELCGFSSWSGTVIGTMQDGTLAVLTCAHGYQADKPVNVEVDAPRWVTGRIVKLDPLADLGMISVMAPGLKDLKSYPVADEPPSPGEKFEVCGYPGGQAKLRCRTTTMTGKSAALNTTEVPFALGESGGAVLQNGRLVGVIVMTDMPISFGMRVPPVSVDIDPDGYVVTHSVTRKFVIDTLGGMPANEYRRSAPAPPAAELADQAASAPGPAAPALPPPLESASEPDWSLLQAIVLIPHKPTKFDAIIGAVERYISDENGAGAAAKRHLNDKTGGKADFELVFQRVHPDRYKELATLAGASDGDAAVLLLVKKQFGGNGGLTDKLKGIIEGIGTGIVQKLRRAKFSNAHFELITEAANADDFEAAGDALELVDETKPESWIEEIVLAALTFIGGMFFHKKTKQGYDDATAKLPAPILPSAATAAAMGPTPTSAAT